MVIFQPLFCELFSPTFFLIDDLIPLGVLLIAKKERKMSFTTKTTQKDCSEQWQYKWYWYIWVILPDILLNKKSNSHVAVVHLHFLCLLFDDTGTHFWHKALMWKVFWLFLVFPLWVGIYYPNKTAGIVNPPVWHCCECWCHWRKIF